MCAHPHSRQPASSIQIIQHPDHPAGGVYGGIIQQAAYMVATATRMAHVICGHVDADAETPHTAFCSYSEALIRYLYAGVWL
jgi:hypothetical protein